MVLLYHILPYSAISIYYIAVAAITFAGLSCKTNQVWASQKVTVKREREKQKTTVPAILQILS